jgi:hypothetical protein
MKLHEFASFAQDSHKSESFVESGVESSPRVPDRLPDTEQALQELEHQMFQSKTRWLLKVLKESLRFR